MKLSSIAWTDFSGGELNVVTGCTPVSAGCQHCYARRIYERFGRDFSRVQTHYDKLARLARIRFGKPICDAAGNVEYVSLKREGHRPMCFLCDTGDLFHREVPNGFVYLVLDTLAERKDVVWQIVTKRAERMCELVTEWVAQAVVLKHLPPHIWLGVTVENQAAADERIPILLDTPAAVRFVSCEPLLEEIDCIQLRAWLRRGIHWCIVGAESGPNRRPFMADWAASIYSACRDTGTAFFGKQDSGLRPGVPLLIDGKEVHQWPTTRWQACGPFEPRREEQDGERLGR